MEMHLQQHVRSFWQACRKSFREHHGSGADRPPAKTSGISTIVGHADSAHSAKSGPAVRAVARGQTAAGHLREQRMVHDLSRTRPEFNTTDPLVFRQLRWDHEIAKHVRTAGGKSEADW